MCNAKILLNWICFLLVAVQVIDGFAYNGSNANGLRIRREAKQGNKGNKNKCPNSTDFACKNGKCISEDKECDGIVDCEDESDESNSCHRIKCPPYVFKCQYGACIDSDKVCDGKPDCRDGSDESAPRCSDATAANSCQPNEFRCSSGQCIDGDLKCDGKADCKDESDEIAATCWNIKCPGFTYRCDYGACVDGNAKCNGKAECFDGSDESHCRNTTTVGTCTLPEHPPHGSWMVVGSAPGTFHPQGKVDYGTVLTVTCQQGYVLEGSQAVVCTEGTWSKMPTCSEYTTFTPKPPVGSGSCVLPEYPKNGTWSVYNSRIEHHPNQPVADGSILQVKCKDGYRLDGVNSLSCMNGTWSSFIGACRRTCPPRKSSSKRIVTCYYESIAQKDCLKPIDGTLAKYKCANFYKASSSQVQVCNDGTWNLEEPQCNPVCGIKSNNAQTLIVNGTTVKKGDYPWHVALYKNPGKQFNCGGSLISQRIIVSAAHCVSDANDGTVFPKEDYIVAVGKYYSKFDDPQDKNYVQTSTLEHIFVPKAYQGSIQNYLADIAVLVTVKTFKLSLKVQPVCLDRGLNYHIGQERTGFVPGWGHITRSGNVSEVLREIEVPLVKDQECAENLPEDYFKYRTYDKMCAGFLDKEKGVCKGDSGGGLVVNFDGNYVLTGIVSLAPQSDEDGGGCDINQYALYTRVSVYLDYIFGIEGRFLPDETA